MSSKPIIAITVESKHDPEDVRSRGKIELNWNYAQAIADAGGVPLVIPPVADMEEVAKLVDGWLIPGGADLDATLWGEENHPAVELQDGTRIAAERKLFETLDPQAPILGICYGCQAINVLRGGSLVQHLPDVVGHEQHTGGTMQAYELEADSLLSRSTSTGRIEGKSYHHQAVGRVAEGLRVVARAEDGTVEAVEAGDRPWMVGVQWHPERTLEDKATRNLFQRFVEAAAEFKSSKGSN